MKVLLLGSGGFVGRHLLNAFVSRGIGVLSPRSKELDFTCDDSVARFIKHHQDISTVVHSAVDVTNLEVNVKIARNLANYCPASTDIINIGSGAEYNRFIDHMGVEEGFFGKSVPNDTYGLSKYITRLILGSNRVNGLLNLRVFGIFGDGEEQRRLLPSLITAGTKTGTIQLRNDGLFSFVPVEDLTRFIVQWLSDDKRVYGDYNFVHTTPLRLSGVPDIIKTLLPSVRIDAPYNTLISNYYGSNSKFATTFKNFRFGDLTNDIKNYLAKIIEMNTND